MTTPSRVLVITKRWTLDQEHPATLTAIRQRIAALGAQLVVLCDSGVWSFHDGTLDHDDQMVADGAMAAMLFAARKHGEAVFVLDGASIVRVGPTDDLIVALDAAAELLAVRRVMTATTTIDAGLMPAFDSYDSTEPFAWSHV